MFIGRGRIARLALVLAAGLVSCSGDSDSESGSLACGDGVTPAVELGRGVGGAFETFEVGSQVSLDIAPQGGFGVTAQVQTLGLAIGPVIVTVRTEIDGQASGSFTFEDDEGAPTQQLFCRDDGRGTLGSGIAIGFDPDRWNQDNLIELDGVTADLLVDIEDETGATATGRATVVVVVGG